MTHSRAAALPPAPSHVGLPSAIKTVAGLALAIGAGALGWSFATGHAALAWSTYLIGAFFALGLGVFGLAWVAILNLSGGTWSVTMRRVPEAMTTWIVPGGLLAMLVMLGAGSLYEWSQPELIANDALLTHKAPFLNMTMFGVLGGVSLIVWAAFAMLIVGASRRQDREGGIAATQTCRNASGAFLVLFALTFSIVSFYFLLSLDAHWFSTMFAVLAFTDIAQTGTAFVALVAAVLVASGTMRGFLNENHLHNIGKMLFAWTGFWAYIYFCQFMLIWYANIPEETVYFLRRSEHGWLPFLLALPALKFVIPFLLLIPRSAKRTPARLVPIALLVLFAQFWELFVMVSPAVGEGETASVAHLPIIEFAGTLGFVGLFTLVFSWAFERNNPVPLKDPGLAACLDYQS